MKDIERYEILDSGYAEHICGKWVDLKKELAVKYAHKYNCKVKILRTKTDTKGLYCYMVLNMDKEV